MTARLTFAAIAGFWAVMNVLLWRTEFGADSGGTPVPVALVWRKILTAPDASSLSVFQNGEPTGYCEFATSVGMAMAAVDSDRPPPEGFVHRAGYLVHLAGNVQLDDFTNRLKFDGQVEFAKPSEWRELTLKISSRLALVEIHSAATNRSLHLKITSNGAVLERDLALADLQRPEALARELLGEFAGPLLGAADLPDFSALPAASGLEWAATRTRAKIGAEYVPVYRLQTAVLGRNITVDVSTLGELLHVQLPGNLTAQIDEWKRP